MNLFIVSTPFQLINALEAIKQYKCKSNIILLREQENENAEEQIKKLLSHHQWVGIVKIKRTPQKSIFPRLVLVLKKIKQLNPNMVFDNVFYTEYPSRRVATILGNISILNKEVMYDDGTWTLKAFEDYLQKNIRVSYSNFKRNLILNLFGFKKPKDFYIHEKFELFTLFDIDSTNFKISKNNLTLLREHIASQSPMFKSTNQRVAFIGDGATKDGINLTEYKKQLSKLAKSVDEVIYFPHRNEEKDIQLLLSNIKNLTYARKTIQPIEFEICKYSNITAIYGYYSTALFTLSKSYPNLPIYTRKLRDDEILNKALINRLIQLIDKYLKGKNINRWQ